MLDITKKWYIMVYYEESAKKPVVSCVRSNRITDNK